MVHKKSKKMSDKSRKSATKAKSLIVPRNTAVKSKYFKFYYMFILIVFAYSLIDDIAYAFNNLGVGPVRIIVAILMVVAIMVLSIIALFKFKSDKYSVEARVMPIAQLSFWIGTFLYALIISYFSIIRNITYQTAQNTWYTVISIMFDLFCIICSWYILKKYASKHSSVKKV